MNKQKLTQFLEEITRLMGRGEVPSELRFRLQDKDNLDLFYLVKFSLVNDLQFIVYVVTLVSQFPRVDVDSIEVYYQGVNHKK